MSDSKEAKLVDELLFYKDRIANLEAALKIADKALSWYADPYNCTPKRDAMYCPTVNKRAWNARAEIKEIRGDSR